MRVLIVEDVQAEAELALRQLEASGLPSEARVVASEAAFRTGLQDFRPHLILSDFTLPGFDGSSALEIARELAPGVPFIFLSGTIGEERAIELLRRGATDYVLKTNPDRLAPVVRRALREVAERGRRRVAELRIRESEQRLRDIIDTSQDWIWELDAAGHFVFSSVAVQHILGLEPAKLSGQGFAAHVHEADREAFATALAVLGPEKRTSSGLVTRWLHADGKVRWLESNLLVLLSPAGEVQGFRGTHRDCTERRQQQDRIMRLSRVLQMQSGINAAVVRIRHRDELLREACRLAQQVGGYERVMVTLLDPETKIARVLHSAGVNVLNGEPREFRIADGSEPDTSLIGRALRTGEVSACHDLTKSEPPVAYREELLAQGFKSVVALPLVVDGDRIGVLSLASRSPDLLVDAELRLLQEMTANLSFALQYRQTEDTVQFLAYFDPLTGLAKRALFCERLSLSLATRLDLDARPIVIAFDVDHLSDVNDGFGRVVGDLLLQRVADRLKDRFEDDERIGYLGSGTFTLVLLGPETSEDSVAALLESAVFKDAFSIEGRSIRVSCTVGMARFPVDGEDASELVHRAEAALQVAKEAGEQSLHYQVQMHSEIAERLSLEHRLRIALDEQQFELHYQPQFSVATGRLEGVEALLRWRDPQEGLMLPHRFLPLLESSGLIVPVGEWILRKAAADCSRWRDLRLGPLRVAVNVSALQVRRRGFVDQVLGIVKAHCGDAYGIDLEITETSLLQDMDGTVRKLRDLQAAGVRIAIDDFGTGYSSLGLLSALPVDLLKIDRSFISGLPSNRASAALVSSIIGLAFAFDLVAVAEGVETPEQLETLRSLKCHQSQGFLHCQPLPLAQLEPLLAQHRQVQT